MRRYDVVWIHVHVCCFSAPKEYQSFPKHVIFLTRPHRHHAQLIDASRDGRVSDVDRLIKSGANKEVSDASVRAFLGALTLVFCFADF